MRRPRAARAPFLRCGLALAATGLAPWPGLGAEHAVPGADLLAGGLPAVCADQSPKDARLVSGSPISGLALADGRTVMLADVGFPEPRLPDAARVIAPGQPLRLHAVSQTPDRWGRFSAHVVVRAENRHAGAGEGVWLSGALVAEGAAFVQPGDGPTACIDALHALERAARAARRGLWAASENRVRSARDPELAAQATGRWGIVEGRVVSVGETKYRHYLNFGRDWNTDFTVTVRSGDVERFAAAGRHPAGLAGRVIRVRGFLRAWNGAAIDVTRPGEIEVVDERD